MRILHTSDWHGFVPPHCTEPFDVVVHSGDLAPNKTRGDRRIEPAWQKEWFVGNAGRIASYCQGKPLIRTPGNHDYYVDDYELQAVGQEVYTLVGTRCVWGGLTFHGHPYTPEFTKEWNYERTEQWLYNELKTVRCDVLISHGPPRGILDFNIYGERCGSTALLAHLADVHYDAVLCGHIHECGGGYRLYQTTDIYNNATTQRVIDV